MNELKPMLEPEQRSEVEAAMLAADAAAPAPPKLKERTDSRLFSDHI